MDRIRSIFLSMKNNSSQSPSHEIEIPRNHEIHHLPSNSARLEKAHTASEPQAVITAMPHYRFLSPIGDSVSNQTQTTPNNSNSNSASVHPQHSGVKTKRNVDDLQREVSTLNRGLQKKSAQIAEMRRQSSSTNTRLFAAEKKVRQLTQHLEEARIAENNLAEDRKTVVDQTRQIQELNIEIRDYKAQIDVNRADFLQQLTHEREQNKLLSAALASEQAETQAKNTNTTEQIELIDAQSENEELRAELHECKAQIKVNHTEYLRELAQEQERYRALEQDLNDHKTRLQAKTPSTIEQSELERAHAENQELRTVLDECKAQIFRSQPKQQLTDSEMQVMYENLNENVSDWVDRQFAYADGFLTQSNLTKVLRPHAAALKTILPDNKSFVPEFYPQAEGLFTEKFVHEMLVGKFGGARYRFPGLNKGVEAFLDRVEEGMQLCQGPSDQTTTPMWNAEVYRILMKDNDYAQDRQNELNKYAKTLHSICEKLRGTAKGPNFDFAKCYRLCDSAAKLICQMRAHPLQYVFEYTTLEQGSALYGAYLDGIDAVDVENMRPLRGGEHIEENSQGQVGTVLGVIRPALKRCGSGGEADLYLSKALVLVEFLYPVVKKSAKIKREPDS